jgi:predicted dehydrogenase
VTPPADGTLRCGVIGVGIWGVNHARAYAAYPRSQLVAVCDVDPGRSERAARELGGVATYVDYREMLEAEDLDAVSVVTPDFTHREVVETCLEAGVATIVEKPLATKQDDLDAILDAADRAEALFATNYMMRWSPRYAKAKQAVDAGHLGAPILGQVRFHDVAHVPRSMISWASEGSPLFFVGCHAIDSVHWVTGRSIVEVQGRAHRGMLAAEGIDADDYVLAFLTLDNGAHVVLEAGWSLPEAAKSYVDQDMRLVGTQGVIEVSHTHGGVEVFSDPLMDPYAGAIAGVGGYPLPSTNMGRINGRMFGQLYESISHWVDCVLDGGSPIVTRAEARHTTEVMLAIATSIESGEAVSVRPAGTP